MKKYYLSISLLLLSLQLYSTHNRAGEILYRQLSGLTFEITIITYTCTGPGPVADRPELEIQWGDNTTSILPRVEEVQLPDYFKRNKYTGTHTYPGAGIYAIVVEDPNRNFGVTNIPNSVNTVFSISTTMYINPQIGTNNTPILTRPPLDKAVVGQRFVHNPGAYDPDGDSLAYRLTPCREENGQAIPGYTYPLASKSFSVNAITGDLVWDAPTAAGVYNVAMIIEEWRNNIKIGEIIRDMQIEVSVSNNRPPVIVNDEDLCIEAGDSFTYIFSANDPNGDRITLSADGYPFRATSGETKFTQTIDEAGHAEAEFFWQTNCGDVKLHPVTINIKAEDNGSPIKLVDMKNINIKVVSPAVKNVNISSSASSISLTWSSSDCYNVTGYNIYRKISPTGYEPDFCQTGVPDELNYTKIAFVEGRYNNNYDDFAVSQGHEYCYLICAVFPDNAESYASQEVCITLLRGIPTITNVSVVSTDENTGEIYIAWSKPLESDIGDAPGPYQYVLYRTTNIENQNFQEITRLNNIDDTIYNDKNINTKEKQYFYKVEFYNNQNSNRFLIGTPNIASSIFLNIEQMENALKLIYKKNVPWINSEYKIFRYNEIFSSFEEISTIAEDEYYIDKQLQNGKDYCYYIQSKGSYSVSGIINPIINNSQISCEQAIDTTPPCVPQLKAESFCEDTYNFIRWQQTDIDCSNDVKFYSLYYTPQLNGEYEKIATIVRDSLSYRHFPKAGMAGCYYITASDSSGNESPKSNRVCLDNCIYYRLPNVFSPNNDGINDIYHPIKPYYFVTKINIQIFNRWGLVMFETDDPEINWDGTNYKNGKPVSDGVYFYNCDVYEQRLTGEEIRHLQGFIHVFNSRKEW